MATPGPRPGPVTVNRVLSTDSVIILSVEHARALRHIAHAMEGRGRISREDLRQLHGLIKAIEADQSNICQIMAEERLA